MKWKLKMYTNYLGIFLYEQQTIAVIDILLEIKSTFIVACLSFDIS